MGDVTPLGVLASVSKVKHAQFWPDYSVSSPSSAPANGSCNVEIKKQIQRNRTFNMRKTRKLCYGLWEHQMFDYSVNARIIMGSRNRICTTREKVEELSKLRSGFWFIIFSSYAKTEACKIFTFCLLKKSLVQSSLFHSFRHSCLTQKVCSAKNHFYHSQVRLK